MTHRRRILTAAFLIILGTVFICTADAVEDYVDIIRLDGGRMLKGAVLEETGSKVRFKTTNGNVSEISKDEIETITYGFDFRKEYKKRLDGCKTAEDFVALGDACRLREKSAEAESCFRKALEIDPENAGARDALGYTLYRGKWLAKDEAAKVEAEAAARAAKEAEEKKKQAAAGITPPSGATDPKKPEQQPGTQPPGQPNPAPGAEQKPEPAKDEPKQPKTDYSIYEDNSGIVSWISAAKTETKHFVIITNVLKYQKHYGDMMEAFYDKFKQVFGLSTDIKDKINVKIYGSKEEYQKYEKRFDGSNGYCHPGKGIFAFHGRSGATATTQTTLAHEGAHYFESLVFPCAFIVSPKKNPALWINEGIAVFFEASEYVDGKFSIGIIPRDRLWQLQSIYAENKHMKFRDVMNVTQDKFTVECYAYAWAYVYYMIYSSKENRRKFDKFLQKCVQGEGFNGEFLDCCDIKDAAEFENEVKDFIQRLDVDMTPKEAGELYERIAKAKKGQGEMPPIVKPKYTQWNSDEEKKKKAEEEKKKQGAGTGK
jgi:tetratricopeptide (TPR) repeat protein